MNNSKETHTATLPPLQKNSSKSTTRRSDLTKDMMAAVSEARSEPDGSKAKDLTLQPSSETQVYGMVQEWQKEQDKRQKLSGWSQNNIPHHPFDEDSSDEEYPSNALDDIKQEAIKRKIERLEMEQSGIALRNGSALYRPRTADKPEYQRNQLNEYHTPVVPNYWNRGDKTKGGRNYIDTTTIL